MLFLLCSIWMGRNLTDVFGGDSRESGGLPALLRNCSNAGRLINVYTGEGKGSFYTLKKSEAGLTRIPCVGNTLTI